MSMIAINCLFVVERFTMDRNIPLLIAYLSVLRKGNVSAYLESMGPENLLRLRYSN
jgi:hypothetical protein